MSHTIAILGGTGPEGRGLGARWARAGHQVVIGSRDESRAQAAAAELSSLSGSSVEGGLNAAAAEAAEIAVVTTPLAGAGDTLAPLDKALAGKLVVSAVNPVKVVDGVVGIEEVAEGSAAALVQARLPGSRVGAAFHNVSAVLLNDLDHVLDEDIPVAADEAADREAIVALCADLGAHGVAVGPLSLARYLEGFTAVLLSVNKLHRSKVGLRFTGLP